MHQDWYGPRFQHLKWEAGLGEKARGMPDMGKVQTAFQGECNENKHISSKRVVANMAGVIMVYVS